MYLKENSNLTLEFIGELFGGRDHATALNAKKTVKDRMEVDNQFRMRVEEIEMKLKDKNLKYY